MASFLGGVLMCAAAVSLSTSSAMAQNKVIFDTDAMTDVDDLGALAVLHALADRGETQILATIVSAKHEYAAPAVQVVNEYYGRPAIPIATLHGPGVLLNSNYKAETLSRQFLKEPIALTSQRPDAVKVYREILAGSADKITIMTVGYATNLRDLLASGPDECSPLTGQQLVAEKVEKWVNMGGNFENRRKADGFPYDMNNTNVNWERDASAAVTAIENWPTQIVYVGREIGHSLRVGAALQNTPPENPVRVGYELFFNGPAKDHHCADLSTVLYAVRGLGHGHDSYWQLERGKATLQPDAKFSWDTSAKPQRGEARIVDALTRRDAALMSLEGVEKVLSDLLTAPPREKDTTAPSAPSNFRFAIDDAGRATITFTPGAETDTGSWVAGHALYREGKRVATTCGTRFTLAPTEPTEQTYEIRAMDASGIESAGVAMKIAVTGK